MNAHRTAVTVGLGAALVAGLTVSSAPAALADEGSRCATGALPPVLLGDPGVQAHQAAAVYLWHGPHGYSLRVTHPGTDTLVVSGVITASRDLARVRRVHLEPGDRVAVGRHGHTLAFRFRNHGYVDGVDFAAECSRTVRVQLHVAGSPAAPSQVFLGKDRTSPTSVPFTIERATAAHPAAVA